MKSAMSTKTYQFNLGGKNIIVTEQEVREFYKGYHTLSEKEIASHAGEYTAHIKLFKQNDRWLDKKLIQQYLDEDRLMKKGETCCFLIHLFFDWHVTLTKEKDGDFHYVIEAHCIDCPQVFKRMYLTMDEALLHCVNSFNENENVPDKYKTLQEYILQPTVKEKLKEKLSELYSSFSDVHSQLEWSGLEDTYASASQVYRDIEELEKLVNSIK